MEGAVRKALWSRPGIGSSRVPSRRSLSLLVGRMVTGGDSGGGGGGSVWIWREARRREGVVVGRRRNGRCAGVGGCGSACLPALFCWVLSRRRVDLIWFWFDFALFLADFPPFSRIMRGGVGRVTPPFSAASAAFPFFPIFFPPSI